MIALAIEVQPLRACAARIEEVQRDAPYDSPPLRAPRTTAYPTITPSRSHSWGALRCSRVVPDHFPDGPHLKYWPTQLRTTGSTPKVRFETTGGYMSSGIHEDGTEERG